MAQQKACSELITCAYRESFFPVNNTKPAINPCSIRDWDIAGGGDWAENRIIPYYARASESRSTLLIRFPRCSKTWTIRSLCYIWFLAVSRIA